MSELTTVRAAIDVCNAIDSIEGALSDTQYGEVQDLNSNFETLQSAIEFARDEMACLEGMVDAQQADTDRDTKEKLEYVSNLEELLRIERQNSSNLAESRDKLIERVSKLERAIVEAQDVLCHAIDLP